MMPDWVLVFCQSSLIAAVLAAACLGVGLFVSRRIKGCFSSTVCYYATAYAIGTGIVAYISLLLSLAHLFALLYVGVVLFCGCLFLCLFGYTDFFVENSNVIKRGREWLNSLSLIQLCIVLIIAFFFICLPTHVLRPLSEDNLVYYMAQAKLIAYLGSYQSIYTFEHLGNYYPYVFEMLFAAAYLLGGDIAGQFSAKLFIIPSIISSIVLLYFISKEIGYSVFFALFCILIFISSQAITISMSNAKMELIGLQFFMAAVLLTLQTKYVNNKKRILAYIAFFVAASVHAKFSNVLFSGLPIFLLYISLYYKELHISDYFFAAGSFLCIFFLGLGLKNWIVAGEPFAPLYVFSEVDLLLRQVWNSEASISRIIASFPLAFVYGDFYMQDGTISPLLCILYVCLLGAVCISWRRAFEKTGFILFISALLSSILWLCVNPSVFTPRYFYPLVFSFIFSFGTAFDSVVAHANFRITKITLSFSILCAALLCVSLWTPFASRYVKEYPGTFSTPLGGAQCAALVNADPREHVEIRLLTSFFEPFHGKFLAHLKFLHHDVPPASGEDFWARVLEKKIDYIIVWRRYYNYEQYKPLFQLDVLPEGLSVERRDFEQSSIYSIRRI